MTLLKSTDELKETMLKSLYNSCLWLFLQPESLVTGLSSYIFGVPVKVIFVRHMITISSICLTILLTHKYIPEFKETCCYGSSVKRRDLGSCDNPFSMINKERYPIRTQCGTYYWEIWLMITLAILFGLFSAFIVYAYERNHMKHVLKERISKYVESAVAYNLMATQTRAKIQTGKSAKTVSKIQENSADDKLSAILNDIFTGVHPTSFIVDMCREKMKASKTLFFLPSMWMFGLWLKGFGRHIEAVAISLLQFTAFIIFCVFMSEEILYKAWKRCYPSDTPLHDLDHGLCKVTLFGHNSAWALWLILFISVECGTLLLYLYFVKPLYQSLSKGLTSVGSLENGDV